LTKIIELSVPSITECAGAIGMADKENAGMAANAQAARPISIERFIGVSLSQPQQRRLEDNAPALQEFPRLAPRDQHQEDQLSGWTSLLRHHLIDPDARVQGWLPMKTSRNLLTR
jgi:hypothetical protein